MGGSAVVALAIVTAVGGAAAGSTQGALVGKAGPAIVGRWGGDRARLDATPTGARLQVECLVARVEKPIAVDPGGRFVVAVTFAPLRGVNLDGQEQRPSSTVSGRIEGDRLSVTITPADAEGAGTFALTRNARAKLPNCLHRS